MTSANNVMPSNEPVVVHVIIALFISRSPTDANWDRDRPESAASPAADDDANTCLIRAAGLCSPPVVEKGRPPTH